MRIGIEIDILEYFAAYLTMSLRQAPLESELSSSSLSITQTIISSKRIFHSSTFKRN